VGTLELVGSTRSIDLGRFGQLRQRPFGLLRWLGLTEGYEILRLKEIELAKPWALYETTSDPQTGSL
jgi:hypothetical protein